VQLADFDAEKTVRVSFELKFRRFFVEKPVD
jgi:hypothetical protein